MSQEIPYIQTPRLTLRPLSLDDAEGMFAIRNQISVMQWTSQATIDLTVSDTLEWIRTRMAETTDFFKFTIELRSPSPIPTATQTDAVSAPRIIGVLGAARFPQIGYMFHPDFWGSGYATEALQAFIPAFWAAIPAIPHAAPPPLNDLTSTNPQAQLLSAGNPKIDLDAVNGALELFAQGRVGTNFMEAVIDPLNLGSAKVLRKCGFTLWAEHFRHFESKALGTRDTAIYRLARPGTVLGTPPRAKREGLAASGFA